jgi:hypothetical protein
MKIEDLALLMKLSVEETKKLLDKQDEIKVNIK